MTRFVVDAGAVLQLAKEEREIPVKHKLLAPTLLRSQALSLLHEAVHAGKLSADVARERIRYLNGMQIRLLGDAELQADALVTLDKKLARAVQGLVEIAPIDALR